MGNKILDTLKNLFPNKNKTSSKSQTMYYLGNNPITNAGTALTFEEFTALSYIMKGIQVIANDIAKINFAIQKLDTTTNHWTELITSKLDFLLNRAPNKNMTGFEFKKIMIWNLFLYSKCPLYLHYEKNETNDSYTLTEIIPIFPDWCSKIWDEKKGRFRYVISQTSTNMNNDGYNNFYNNPNNIKNNEIILEDWQVLWIDYEIIQGITDISFRNLFKGSLAKLKENETALMNAIKNDTGMSMFVKVPDLTSEQQRKNLQQSLDQMIQSQKKHGSIVFVGDTKWDIMNNEKVIKSNIDYQARNAVAREAASMLNLPPSKLGIEDSNKYNSLVERQKGYVDECLNPILNNICAKLTNFFFPNLPHKQIAVKALDLISLDINTLQSFAASAINNGYATPNEIRALIGFNPHEDGDILLANGSLQDIGLNHQKLKLEIKQMKKEPKEEKPAPPQPENTENPQEQPQQPDENDSTNTQEPKSQENDEKNLKNDDKEPDKK